MKITLRQSNALQAAIQLAIKAIKVETAVGINEFQEPGMRLANAAQDLLVADKRRASLLRSVYSIRASVGVANATSGIDRLLTDAAYMDKRIAQLTALTESAVLTPIDEITGKLAKISSAPSTSYFSRSDSEVASGVLNQEQIDGYKGEVAKLKKQKQHVNDKVLELNVRTEVVLDDATVQVLTEEGLL